MRKTAYEMRMSDWSSDVCSSDLTSLSLFGRSGQPLGSYSVRVTGAEREIAAQFRREPGLEAIDVDRMGEKLVLRGSIPDQDTRQRATAIAKAYAGDGLTDLTSITGRQMVAVDVRFAAVSAGTLRALGFNFRKQIGRASCRERVGQYV